MGPQTKLPHPPPVDIIFHRLFFKDWRKLRHDKFRQKFTEDILPKFQNNPFDTSFRNHDIGETYPRCRSIDFTGDIRAFYTIQGKNVVFVRIGTHSHLYG